MDSPDPTPLPYRYRAYGLAIHSDLELPELAPDTADDREVVVRRRQISRPYAEPPANITFQFEPQSQYLAWTNVGRYLISGKHQIGVDPAPGASEPLVRLPLVGPVMALLLHLRGLLVLHASAVAIGDRSAIFLGDKQAGKSTTAAALVAAGHRLLTDDTLAIDFTSSGQPLIVPGFPQIKLSLDAAAAVADDRREAQPPPYEGFEKRQHRLVDRFSHDRTTPTRIYVLARGADAAFTPLTPDKALMSLVRYSYVKRFGAHALGDTAGRHLQQCAALASSVRMGRLELPGNLGRLDEAVRLVEHDLA